MMASIATQSAAARPPSPNTAGGPEREASVSRSHPLAAHVHAAVEAEAILGVSSLNSAGAARVAYRAPGHFWEPVTFVAACAMTCLAFITILMPEMVHFVAFIICGAAAAFANWRADVAAFRQRGA